jgi:hypothetical protein
MSMGEKQQAVYRKPNGDPDGNDYILAEGETSCWATFAEAEIEEE